MKENYRIIIPAMINSPLARQYYEQQMREFLEKRDRLTPTDIERARNTFYRDALDIQDNPFSIDREILSKE